MYRSPKHRKNKTSTSVMAGDWWWCRLITVSSFQFFKSIEATLFSQTKTWPVACFLLEFWLSGNQKVWSVSVMGEFNEHVNYTQSKGRRQATFCSFCVCCVKIMNMTPVSAFCDAHMPIVSFSWAFWKISILYSRGERCGKLATSEK